MNNRDSQKKNWIVGVTDNNGLKESGPGKVPKNDLADNADIKAPQQIQDPKENVILPAKGIKVKDEEEKKSQLNQFRKHLKHQTPPVQPQLQSPQQQVKEEEVAQRNEEKVGQADDGNVRDERKEPIGQVVSPNKSEKTSDNATITKSVENNDKKNSTPNNADPLILVVQDQQVHFLYVFVPFKKIQKLHVPQMNVEEYIHAWGGYKKCAWGHDVVAPLSCRGSDEGYNMGLTIIDGLDTLILMYLRENKSDPIVSSQLKRYVQEARDWIERNLHFDRGDVSFFETTIRVVGGLLSAFHFTNDSLYLDKVQIITDKLMVAFNTPTGLPLATVSLESGTAYNPSWAHGSLSTSEGGSVQLEFNYLSYLTNHNEYALKARKAQQVIVNAMNANDPPLLRKWISNDKGTFTDSYITFGSRVDSAYEYFLKNATELFTRQRRHLESMAILVCCSCSLNKLYVI
ncbi:hypothetical protein RFI_06618 [Reticulomyxa filosa]|uniref:alpha-1,2-Mannosidase n=1 Tax=Reticulomyxa filosa TaxID=46433 RepID=X6NX89_RETFI|nr:hypothetical protein RFI_06618 [Reticulomyxa filosa]|eukprot:ETO30503.1 hypothetical protein RFI_06618 [Reticulomyxa filosa]